VWIRTISSLDPEFQGGSTDITQVQVEWPQKREVEPKYLVTIEHLADNNELVILVDDGSGDGQPECIWSSVGLGT
jgi:hypothetical protein